MSPDPSRGQFKRSASCLELEIECCTSATQDSEVFVESETAPLKTVPLTEELIQTDVFKRHQRFRNQRFCCFKRQGFSSRYIR